MNIKFSFDEKNVQVGFENQFAIKDLTEKSLVKILMLKGEKGDTTSAEWGTITGNISSQTDLKNALDNKANLSDIPDVSSFITKDVNNLSNYTKTSDLSTVATSGSYTDLSDKPSIPTATSDLVNDSGFIDNTVNNLTNYTPTSNLSTVATSGSYSDLSNTPTIPDELSDLSDDATHRLVTDTEKATWNGKSDFSGSYNDLTDTPTIPSISDSYSTSTSNGYSSNYVNTQIGNLSNLQTTETSNIVGAINSLMPVSLFDAPAGSLTVTLNDSASNYNMLYIETIGLQYTTILKTEAFIVNNPNNKTISKTYGFYNSINNQIYIVTPIFTINGTSITISNNQAGTVGANNAYLGSNDTIGITKVLGYK